MSGRKAIRSAARLTGRLPNARADECRFVRWMLSERETDEKECSLEGTRCPTISAPSCLRLAWDMMSHVTSRDVACACSKKGSASEGEVSTLDRQAALNVSATEGLFLMGCGSEHARSRRPCSWNLQTSEGSMGPDPDSSWRPAGAPTNRRSAARVRRTHQREPPWRCRRGRRAPPRGATNGSSAAAAAARGAPPAGP